MASPNAHARGQGEKKGADAWAMCHASPRSVLILCPLSLISFSFSLFLISFFRKAQRGKEKGRRRRRSSGPSLPAPAGHGSGGGGGGRRPRAAGQRGARGLQARGGLPSAAHPWRRLWLGATTCPRLLSVGGGQARDGRRGARVSVRSARGLRGRGPGSTRRRPEFQQQRRRGWRRPRARAARVAAAACCRTRSRRQWPDLRTC